MKITFLKRSEATNGNVYDASIMSFDLPDAMLEAAAIVEAVKLFQEHAKVEHWQEAADRYIIT